MKYAEVSRKNITQPVRWWAAFEAQAEREGLTLSAWLGKQGMAGLSKTRVRRLPPRPEPGRKPD